MRIPYPEACFCMENKDLGFPESRQVPWPFSMFVHWLSVTSLKFTPAFSKDLSIPVASYSFPLVRILALPEVISISRRPPLNMREGLSACGFFQSMPRFSRTLRALCVRSSDASPLAVCIQPSIRLRLSSSVVGSRSSPFLIFS